MLDNDRNYTYIWSTGDTTDQGQLKALSSGDYVVTITDGFGCSNEYTFDIPASTNVFLNAHQRSASCENADRGKITYWISGGNGQYMLSIDGGATFHDPGELSDLAAGDYVLIAKDSAGCADTTDVTIGYTDLVYSQQLQVTGDSCGLGRGTLVVTNWNDYQLALDGQPFSMENEFYQLDSGWHHLYVMDHDTCISSDSFFVPYLEDIQIEYRHCPAHNLRYGQRPNHNCHKYTECKMNMH